MSIVVTPSPSPSPSPTAVAQPVTVAKPDARTDGRADAQADPEADSATHPEADPTQPPHADANPGPDSEATACSLVIEQRDVQRRPTADHLQHHSLNGATYTWTFTGSGNGVSHAKNPGTKNYPIGASGTFFVTLVVKNSAGKSSTSTQPINVVACP